MVLKQQLFTFELAGKYIHTDYGNLFIRAYLEMLFDVSLSVMCIQERLTGVKFSDTSYNLKPTKPSVIEGIDLCSYINESYFLHRSLKQATLCQFHFLCTCLSPGQPRKL